MKSLSVAWKDMQIFLKDRGQIFMLFLLPLVFILAFGFAYSQLSDQVQLVELHVVNLDPGGELSQALIDSLSPIRGVEVKLHQEAEAQSLLEEGEIDRILIIPAGFSQAIDGGQHVILKLVNGRDANEGDTEAVYAVIDGVAKDLSLQTQLIAAFQQMGQMRLGTVDGVQVFSSDIIVNQAKSQFERAKTAPLVAVEQKVPTEIMRAREEAPNAMEIAIPGFTVLFCFMTAGTTAMAIYTEKKLGTFRRLLSAPLGKIELLSGKMLPNLIIVLLQVAIIFAVGGLLMPLLGMDRISPGNLPALAVVSVLVAVCSTSLGLLIVALARTEGQISGIATVVLWVAGAVAGAFIPQFLLGDFLNTVGRVTPHYWAISAYTGVIVRSQGLADITTQLGILVLFTFAFFAVGLWRFRLDW
jgi:ABC-2 type transport system permease protein